MCAVKAHGLVPSYVLLAIAGFGSFMLLPVALELACEVTRNAEFSSAIMWFTANALTVFFVLSTFWHLRWELPDALSIGTDTCTYQQFQTTFVQVQQPTHH